MSKANSKYRISLASSIVAILLSIGSIGLNSNITLHSIIIIILLLGIGMTFWKKIKGIILPVTFAVGLVPAHFLILNLIITLPFNPIHIYAYSLLTLSTSIIYNNKRYILTYLPLGILLLGVAIFFSEAKTDLLPLFVFHFFLCLLWGMMIAFRLPDTFSYLDDDVVDYKYMMENLEEGVMFVDNNNKCLEVNQRWEEITGYPRNQLIGKDVRSMLLYPEDIQFMEEQSRERTQGKSNRYELRIKTKSEGDKWVLTIGTPLLNKKGKVIGSLGIMADRTEAVKKDKQLLSYSRELETSMSKLKRANDELEQFAYVVSHDLRSPLNTISSFSNLLERRYKEELSKDAHEYIEFIQSGCANMFDIIEGLLQLARLGPNKMKKEITPLHEIVNNSILNLRSEIKKNEAVITYADLHPVYCDKTQILQLFQNLIENSIKYKKEGVSPEIDIWSEKRGNGVEIYIKDNGIGIPKEYQDKIFWIFNQINNKMDGIGIGLTTCKKIVENHNGNIEIDSEEGKGCVFKIYLSGE